MIRLAQRFVRYGTAAYAPRVKRRLSLVNMVAGASGCANLVYCLFYAVQDAAGLGPLIAGTAVNAAANFSTPLWHRFGTSAGALWLICENLVALGFYGYALGPDAGVQIYFVAFATGGPILLGAGRLIPATIIVGLSLAGLMAVELAAPGPAPFIRVTPDMLRINELASMAAVLALIFIAVCYLVMQAERAEDALEQEFARSERLLGNLLPESISTRLKASPERGIAEDLNRVTILFADIVGFTPRATRLPAAELVRFLNQVFTEFDRLTELHGLEKIKTIGDAYMAAGGLPVPHPHQACAAADLALDMRDSCMRLTQQTGQEVELRIGIHTGPAVAGVIGTHKFFYDVWGDTVNTAARMERQGEPGRIQITREVRDDLGDAYVCAPRGHVDIRGKGAVETWWLTGRA